MVDDKQTTLMQHLSLISNVFEAVVQYTQSLQVSYLAAKRVFDMSHTLLACPFSSANTDDFISYRRQVILSVLRILYLFVFQSYNFKVIINVDLLGIKYKERERKNFFILIINYLTKF